MGTICMPAVAQARRLSAEEFCRLVRREASSIYCPRSEVLRMLALGEAWGTLDPEGEAEGSLLLLPLGADLRTAAALRTLMRRKNAGQGILLTPPVGQAGALPLLLEAGLARAKSRSRGGPVWAVLECTPEAEELVPLYLEKGLILRAIRPLNSLAPCWLFAFAPGQSREDPVWVPLEDHARLAVLLSRGRAALDSRPGPEGTELALCPV